MKGLLKRATNIYLKLRRVLGVPLFLGLWAEDALRLRPTPTINPVHRHCLYIDHTRPTGQPYTPYFQHPPEFKPAGTKVQWHPTSGAKSNNLEHSPSNTEYYGGNFLYWSIAKVHSLLCSRCSSRSHNKPKCTIPLHLKNIVFTDMDNIVTKVKPLISIYVLLITLPDIKKKSNTIRKSKQF